MLVVPATPAIVVVVPVAVVAVAASFTAEEQIGDCEKP
jgi:hypothetical protein